jgi:hypothetical protein
VPSWPALKEAFNATGYWRIEEGSGCRLLGEMKRRKHDDFFPFSGGGRPMAAPALFWCGEEEGGRVGQKAMWASWLLGQLG